MWQRTFLIAATAWIAKIWKNCILDLKNLQVWITRFYALSEHTDFQIKLKLIYHCTLTHVSQCCAWKSNLILFNHKLAEICWNLYYQSFKNWWFATIAKSFDSNQKDLKKWFYLWRKNAKSIRIFIVIKIVSCVSPNIARVQIKMSVWCSLVVQCISLRSFSILNLFPIEKTSFILDGSK